MTEVIDINQLLKQHKGPNGISLFDHLCAVIDKMVHSPKDAQNFEEFEKISSFVKKNLFAYKAPKSDHEVNQHKDYTTQMTQWYEDCLKLLEKTQREDAKSRKHEVKSLGAVQNVQDDLRIAEIAGVYFGQEEGLLIAKSIAKLAVRTKARELRFWGKILGSSKDYYVAEGILDNTFSDDAPTPDSERAGTGCNRLTFWTVNNILDDWIELPLITPQQLNTARKIKHIFSGDLNASVNTYPTFPGKEKHYLKAQLVRISHGTVLVPKDLRKVNDEDSKKEELEYTEDGKYIGWDEIKEQASWLHYHPNILEAGRVRHYVPPTVKEDERDAYETQKGEEDPVEERLKPITEDKISEKFRKDFGMYKFFNTYKFGEEEKLWFTKPYGDLTEYAGKDESKLIYGAIAHRSLLWPGAITVASVSSWVNLYIGYGHKSTTQSIGSTHLGVVQDDLDDVNDQPEPQPLSGPKEIPESDSEAEKEEENKEDDV